MLNLGNTLLGQEKVDEAIACYRHAIELNPKLSPAYHNIGEILSRKQEWQEAINAYRHSIQVKPDNAGRIMVWQKLCSCKNLGKKQLLVTEKLSSLILIRQKFIIN
jgi:tetratricopeptide (TPR) repeat protein